MLQNDNIPVSHWITNRGALGESEHCFFYFSSCVSLVVCRVPRAACVFGYKRMRACAHVCVFYSSLCLCTNQLCGG